MQGYGVAVKISIEIMNFGLFVGCDELPYWWI